MPIHSLHHQNPSKEFTNHIRLKTIIESNWAETLEAAVQVSCSDLPPKYEDLTDISGFNEYQEVLFLKNKIHRTKLAVEKLNCPNLFDAVFINFRGYY